MAFITCNFYSKALGFETTMNVILPGDSKSDLEISSLKNQKFPVLYLLHGLSDDHTAWVKRTAIERYVSDHNIAVVMPDAGKSFYTNMKHGYDYFTFISEEVPAIAELLFPISSHRDDKFIAGLSMGGYGALKIAFSKPESFSKAASLSGATDILALALRLEDEEGENLAKDFYNIFGSLDSFEDSKHDLFALSKECSKAKVKPEIYITCGTEDFLYQDNVKFKKHLSKLPIDFIYDEAPGDHLWDYWDLKIQEVLKWINIKPL